MANTAQARKRVRQAEKHRAANTSKRSEFRTAVKKVIAAIQSKDKTAAEAAYKAALPMLDKMATKGIVAKNKVARHKSRLTAHIKAIA